MNASFYLLGGGSGWGRGRPGQAESWIAGCPRPSKGTLFGLHSLPQTQPRSPGSHGQSPAGYTPSPRDARPTQHVAQGPSFPLVTRLLPSPRFAGAQPQLPPPPPCGGTVRRGLGGLEGPLRCRAGESGRAGRGGIPLECFGRLHPTRRSAAWIGQELQEPTLDWPGAVSGPAPRPRLRERPQPEFVQGRAGRAQGGGGAGECSPQAGHGAAAAGTLS